MVTLITEKMGRQSLEDVEFAPIDQSVRRSWELTATDTLKFSVAGIHWSMSAQHETSCTPPVKRYCHALSMDGSHADPPPQLCWQPEPSSIWRRPSLPPAVSPVTRPASATSSGYHESCATPPFKRSISMEESPRRGVTATGGSMPVIPPLSPLRGPPRCRSQPCVQLHKAALKRRRPDHRPTIDLFKSKEISHDVFGRTRHRSLQFVPQDYSMSTTFSRCSSTPGGALYNSNFDIDSPACLFGLKTIASSPLDGNSSMCPAGVFLPPAFASSTAAPHAADNNSSDDSDEPHCGADETVFTMDMSTAIDLEQIEKD